MQLSDDRRGRSRRTTLRAIGVAMTGLALAGCSGDGTETPTQDRPALPAYTQWLSAPSAVGDRSHYLFVYTDYATIRANEPYFAAGEFEGFRDDAAVPELGLGLDTVEELLSVGFGTATIARGRFTTNTVTNALGANGYEQVDSASGYTLYTDGDRSAAAVRDNTALLTPRGGRDPVNTVRTVLDTRAGYVDRYADTNGEFVELARRLGDGTIVTGATSAEVQVPNRQEGRFTGEVASGSVTTVDGKTTTTKRVAVFADRAAIDMAGYRQYVNNSAYWDGFTDVVVKQDGRSVVVTGSFPTAEYIT